ncbi:AMP-binding protein [Mycobacterium vicinigordonae]|uniref:AMP-binding protein n=1 Tax=Mycobacterium vicinigordonae TaxID=1719132 RepID=A0A7D6HXY0_9MYCO|nr:AMP-binding protein [Mycobacterium vicinigordonae]QLL07395.1 AMP-binding protein [Mycobacterium vicinigordonae]
MTSKILPYLLERAAEDRPDDIVFRSVEQGDLTYSGLHAAHLRWAAALDGLGVRRGDTVASLMPIGFEAYHCWMGAAWLSAIEVPINTAWRNTWLHHGLALSGARVLVCAQRYLPQIAQVAQGLTALETIVVYDADDPSELDVGLPTRIISGPAFFAAASATPRLSRPADDDLMAIIFTSGTTGQSKGVMCPWAQWSHADGKPGVFRFVVELGCPFIYYAPFVPYHLTGKGALIAAAQLNGQVVMREKFRTDVFWDDIRNYGCTSTLIVGAMGNFLMKQPPSADDGINPLRGVLMAPILPDVDTFKKRFNVEVCTIYGMTEIGHAFMSDGFAVDRTNWASCGHVNEGFEVRLVDATGRDVAVGETGELLVRVKPPRRLNRGYWRMSEATAQVWRDGWFVTGDAFRRDEVGNYYFVDRIKDAIRRRGENISSFEIEEAVNEHPDVLESAAVAAAGEFLEDEVKVFIVPCPGKSLEPTDLITFLIPRLARYAIPRFIEIVDALPKTPTQRIRKAELRKLGNSDRTWDRELAGVELPK